jgi:hypothetical protein
MDPLAAERSVRQTRMKGARGLRCGLRFTRPGCRGAYIGMWRGVEAAGVAVARPALVRGEAFSRLKLWRPSAEPARLRLASGALLESAVRG